jgi:PAS domain S-box-containing protein
MIRGQDILNARILIVDDNPANVRLLEEVLTSNGYTSVLTITDSRETVDLYKSFQPDLVLLDINMPHLNGYQVMEQLKEVEPEGYVPILVLTALQDNETRLRSLKFGAKDFLSKPFNITETLVRIRNMLEVRLLHNQVQDQNASLEQKVDERTHSLTEVNKVLSLEIDKHKYTENILRNSESKFKSLTLEFRTLLDGINEPIVLISSEMKILWANRSAAALSGREITDMKGLECHRLLINRQTPCDNCLAIKCFQGGESENIKFSTPDGRYWQMSTFPVKDENGIVKNVIEICKDITEEMILQTEVMRTGQLAELGVLSASVAHEVNNPVFGIISCAEVLLQESDGSNGDSNEILNMILKESRRIANVTRSLLSFARDTASDVESSCRIEGLISDTLILNRALLRKEGVNLETHFSPNLPDINGYPQRLQQVFMNLINNARYSLSKKYLGNHENKILDIKCSEEMIDDSPYVHIIFHDRGMGIPDDKIGKIMDPFFTTKPRGEGTGLGLSICKKIINESGGNIEVESVEGEYTRFVITLPAAG